MKMRCLLVLCLSLAGVFRPRAADVTLPVLNVGSEVYSNVTIIGTNTTHLTFTHSRGMGSVKLKNLPPELQKQFHFDSEKASEAETKQREADSQFRVAAVAQAEALKKAAKKPATQDVQASTPNERPDPVSPRINAKSFRGQHAPDIIVDKWVSSPPPGLDGKFVLVDFWATWCGPCRAAIPHMNELHAKFQDKLVVIGLSDESVADIQKMTSPQMDYFVGSDPKGRMHRAVAVTAIPHVMLLDAKGIVRYEGAPSYLTAEAFERLYKKYSE